MTPVLHLGLTTKLVGAQHGDLPIILSAPHGGDEEVAGVPVRTGAGLERGGTGFCNSRDIGTEELLQAVAAAIERQMQKRPYFVVARFHRKYVDVNRPASIGLESPEGRRVYDAYHQTLSRYCREVKRTYGRGLLLDLHGQRRVKDTIFRGTRNGKTVGLLRRRFGEEAHTGPNSFLGLLAAHGCKVHPANGAEKERAGYTGGYIVRRYGSQGGYGIDAIQLEFGWQYRAKSAIKATAAKVAGALEAYVAMYLGAMG